MSKEKGKEGEGTKGRGRRKGRGKEGRKFTPSTHFASLQIEKRAAERELTTCTASFIAFPSGLLSLGTGLKPSSVFYEIVALDTNHPALAALLLLADNMQTSPLIERVPLDLEVSNG